MSSVSVRVAKPDDRDSVVQLMTLAFCADPTCRWLFRGGDDYLTHFPAFTHAFGGVAFEHGTSFSTEGLEGAALWFPPDVHADSDAILSVVESHAERDYLDDILDVFEQMDRYHPKEPHWYLAMIGVDPARQGKGTGSALLREALSLVDEQVLPAYLESSNPANVPLYERHGFEVMGEIRSGDGPTIFPMFRSTRG